jgi:hypothetical protein
MEVVKRFIGVDELLQKQVSNEVSAPARIIGEIVIRKTWTESPIGYGNFMRAVKALGT